MRKCEELLKSVHSTRPRDWISQLAHGWQVAKASTRVMHVEDLKSHASWSTTGQNFQFGQAASSRLSQVTRSLCLGKTDLSHSKHTPV